MNIQTLDELEAVLGMLRVKMTQRIDKGIPIYIQNSIGWNESVGLGSEDGISEAVNIITITLRGHG